MPIITKAGTPVKGSPTQFTLDKSALAAVTSVAADAYFSDTDNWKEVVLLYKSSTGTQKEIVKFDASLASPTANFSVSAKALDIFEIHRITIKDFDGDAFQISRSELTVAEFDVDMTPATGVSVIWDTFISGFTLGADGFISKAGAVSDYGYCPRSSSGFAGDFEITFEALDTDILNGWCVGVSTSLSDPENGANQIMFYKESGYGMSVYSNGFLSTGLAISSGNNIFKIIRVGSLVSFYLNNSLINTSNRSETVYPEARVGGTVRKAYYVNNPQAVAWVNPASDVYNIEADGGLTNGVNRGGSTYYTISADSQVMIGDFELKFNVGAWTHDSAFGVRTTSGPSLYTGSVGYSGGGSNNVHVNESSVGVFGPALSGKEWKIQRIGSTTNMYTDGVLTYTTTSLVGPVKPVATLQPGSGGSLISATIQAL